MDKLNIDFKSLLPYAIDAFTRIYGEEYRDIISKKINNAIIASYHDTDGLSDYLSYIKNCKKREYAIKFLDKIGLNVEKHIKDNYTQPLDAEVEKVLEYYIDSSLFGFSKYNDYLAPIQAFKVSNQTNSAQILSNKLKIINYLIGNDHEQITEENFDSFIETKEYQEILKQINEINIIYDGLLSEYREWETQFIPYEEYVEDEKKRKEAIEQEKKIEVYRDIYPYLPSSVKKVLFSKTTEEECNTILGNMDISTRFIIESFRSEQMEKLNSKNVAVYNKYWIVHWQSTYLKNLGINISNDNMLNCTSEEDINEYLNFISQHNIREYIPSDALISQISSAREKKYEEALREYYTTRKDFVDIMRMIGNTQNNFEYIYDQIKNKRICIAGQGATRADNEFVSIMLYTIRTYSYGNLFHNFMHECGHIIDQSPNGTGFEAFDDFCENSEKNPYDNAYRKYEKFNEVLNDIFTIEAVELLHSQGIYLIEPKEFTMLDTSDLNTALITKKLLQPLVSKFRQQVIKAKVNADPEELIRCIGKDNFEELVDAVNKVDYLSRNGVVSKIDTSPKDEMVKEYFEQVERVKEIYINIDNYSEDNLEPQLVASNNEIRKSR